MLFKIPKLRLPRSKWNSLKTLSKNEDGVAAIEFALIAPIMALLYFGSIELSLLMEADRRVTTVTATIGDLTSREVVVRNDDVNDIFEAASLLLSPLDPDIAELRITSLIADSNGVVTVDWSDGLRTTPRQPGSQIDDLPNGIVPAGGSIILAEVAYDYDSPINYLGDPDTNGKRSLTDKRIEDSFYLRPRRTNIIQRDTSG